MDTSLEDELKKFKKSDITEIKLPDGKTIKFGQNKIKMPTAKGNQLQRLLDIPTIDIPIEEIQDDRK